MAYVYKITNCINQKIYIGQTSFSIEKRWKEHIQDIYKHLDRPLYRALAKYGVENFIIELIEETDFPNEREEYWIQYYQSFHNGYNVTTGGEGRPKVFTPEEVEAIVTLYGQKESIRNIAATLEMDPSTISHKLTSLGYEIDNHRNLKMEVYQLDKKTNAIIAQFESTRDAARSLGDERKNAHIRECCRGLRKSAYGYKWSFVSDYPGV